MLIITGGSGSGKSTIFNEIVEKHGLRRIVACTTREKRPNEEEGKDYHFLDEETFLALESQDFFAESSIFNGWHYGTALKDYENGADDLAVILSPEAARKIKNRFQTAYIVYMDVPRRERLMRILERGDNVDEAFRKNVFEEGQFSGFEKEADLVVGSHPERSIPELAERIMSVYQS